jgi:hypothetical protein
MRWAGEMGAAARRGCRTRWRPCHRLIDLAAGGPRHRTRLQPSGLHPHVPQHHEAQGTGQAGLSTQGCLIAPRLLAARDLLWVRPALHRAAARISAAPKTIGRAPRPSHTCRASASPRCWSTRSTTPSCRPAALPEHAKRSAQHVTLWQPQYGGHVGFVQGPAARPCADHARRPSAAGCSARWAARFASIIAPWTTSSDRRSPNGPMCPTAMAGWGWTREATGTCAMTARRPSVHSPRSMRPGPPGARGSLLKHEKLIEFIQRNYEARPCGAVVLPERTTTRLR